MMIVAQLAGNAPTVAGTGSAAPGDGTALGAVGSVVLDLAPEVGRWLFGSGAPPIVAAIQSAVSAVTGTSDPSAQTAVLVDPDKAATLRIELARIVAGQAEAGVARQAALVAQMAGTTDTRSMDSKLTQAATGCTWGAPVISVIVLGTFGAVVTIALVRARSTNAEPVLNVLLGTLGAMATSVVSYWVGSSAGSARKEAQLASLARRT